MGLIDSGKIWPYAISIAILTFFGAIVYSVTYIVKAAPVQRSNTYMMSYDHADLQANEIIQARINFNKKYKIAYVTESLAQENSTIKYKLTDLEGKVVNDAKIKIIITRPDNHKHDQTLENPSVENGVYSFSNFSLSEAGRWNIMAKVSIGEVQRFYSVKADTRAKEAFEY